MGRARDSVPTIDDAGALVANSSLLVVSTVGTIVQVWCLIHGAAGVDINVAGIGVVWRSGTLERAISKVTLVSNGPVHEDWAGCGKRGREGHCLREVTLPLLQLKCWGIAPAPCMSRNLINK